LKREESPKIELETDKSFNMDSSDSFDFGDKQEKAFVSTSDDNQESEEDIDFDESIFTNNKLIDSTVSVFELFY
jgi:hypothetical protein